MAARDIKAGRAYVEMMLKRKRFQSGLQAVKRSLMSFGKVAGLAAVAVGGISFAKAIRSASDLEETMSKFNTVFGDRAKAVKEWGDSFADTVGRSKKEVASFLAENQDLFVPLGFEPGAAESMSKQLTTLAVDLASFNNKTDADAMRDLQSAIIGNHETVKKYGIVLNEAALKAHALSRGIDPKNMSEQQKALARMEIILKGSSAAIGDAEKTSGSFANQWKALQAELDNTITTVGGALLPVITDLVSWIREGVGWVSDFAATVQGPYSEALGYMASSIGSLVSSAGGSWTAMAGDTGGFLTWLQDSVIGALSVVSFGFQNWQKVGEMALVSMGLSSVRFGNQVVHVFSEVIPQWLGWFADNWRDVFADVASFTGTVFANLYKNIRHFWDNVFALLSGEEWDFEWTPLTKGFESAVKQWPEIAEREIGGLEKSLQGRLDGLAGKLVNEFEKHDEKFALNKFKSDGEGFAKLAADFRALREGAKLEKGEGGLPDISKLASGAAGKRTSGRVVSSFSAAALQAAGRAGDSVQHRLLEKQVSKLEQVNAGIRNVERAIERGAALS